MGVFTKKKVAGDDEDLFASAVVNLNDPTQVEKFRAVVNASKIREGGYWDWYDKLGEIHYAVSRSARVAGYADLFPVQYDKNGKITKIITGGAEAAIVSGIFSPYGGVRGLVERFFTIIKIPADAYLIRCRGADGAHEGYDVVSAIELNLGSWDSLARSASGLPSNPQRLPPISRIVVPGSRPSNGVSTDAFEVELKPADILGRIWRPSKRYVEMPDSPMAPLEDLCEILYALTLSIKSRINSRFPMNGILFIPSSIGEVLSTGADALDDEGKTPGRGSRNIDRLIQAMRYNIQNRGDADGAAPIVIEGPGEAADQIRDIEVSRDIAETDMKLRAEVIDRILTGLDVQPTSVKGVGDASHFSAWAAEDDERRVNVAPDVEMMVWALSRMILRAEMQALELPAGRIAKAGIWYDLSRVNVASNQEEAARQAHDRVIVSDAGARRMSNIPETDAPPEVEQIRRFGHKHGDPYLATFELDIAKRIDWEKVATKQPTGPAPGSPADTSPTGPGNKPGTRGGRSESDTPKSKKPA